MNPVTTLQFLEQVLVPLQWQVRMQPTLHEDSAATQPKGLFHLFEDLFKTQYVSLAGTGFPEEGTKRTNRGTDVAVVNIAVDDIGHHVVGVQLLAQTIR